MPTQPNTKSCKHPNSFLVWWLTEGDDRIDGCYCPACKLSWMRWWRMPKDPKKATMDIVGWNVSPHPC